ncbi:MAG: YlmH/Sll1252 family protein [Agathobacter sp.]|nr:YlmH/Sll1252 family protein [Agathobacter sp.]
MDEFELCKKRLIDLSRQADRKDIVTFSAFLNLYEQNIYHSIYKSFYSDSKLFGGYDNAERQMVAFIPDALCYEWNYPIVCIEAKPLYPKYAERLTHRDILGALMHLGIDRSKIGDIICQDGVYHIFCEESIHTFIMNQLTQIRHTMVQLSLLDDMKMLEVTPKFEEKTDMIASNRIDAIIAKVYHLSRSEAVTYLSAEKVFINGKCITNCNQSCENGAIVSVRGKGRFIFETDQSLSKKGKLRVRFLMYQ